MAAQDELRLLRIENEQLRKQLTEALELAANAISQLQIAIKDELTGLYDTKTLSRILDEEINHALDARKPLALILIDIDDMKGINDHFGLPAGDHVIRELAKLLSGNVPSTTLLARTGGDEITIVLPETTTEEASKIAMRLCEITRIHPFSHKYAHQNEPEQIPVTISLGVAGLPIEMSNEHDSYELTSAAHWAVIDAKKKGRNCIAVYAKP